MMRILFVAGVIVLIFGLVLYLSPPALSSFSSGTGITSSSITASKTLYFTVKPGNYSDLPVALSSQNNLVVNFESQPAGVGFLLMNQGNFTKFSSGNGSTGGVQIYNVSRLDVSNYSFSFSPNTLGSQNYHLVFKSLAGRNVTTDIVLSFKITTQSSAFDVSYVQIAVLLISLILLGFGVFGGGRRRGGRTKVLATPTSTFGKETASCKFCGASISTGSVFCPTCQRSQV
jgi:hypothetical protein